MKFKKLFSLSLASILFTTSPCYISVQAQELSPDSQLPSLTSETISPRYACTEDTYISIDPSSKGVNYSIRISGIDIVTSTSGDLLIYKDNSLIYSTKLSTSSDELNITSSISSHGKGNYKIQFIGYVYSQIGNDYINISSEDSY